MREEIKMEYKAGLIKSQWGRKFMWQLEKNVDNLYCEAYEVETVIANNKQKAMDILNKKYGKKYDIRKKPFTWNEGWW